jgi:ABC-type amino acid transport system permease subunit
MHLDLREDVVTAELVSELERSQHRTIRARCIAAIGPLTALVGVIWAIVQPYRVTLLHPHGQTFWWLVVEPPVLVVLVGLFFYFVIAPGVLEDFDAASR